MRGYYILGRSRDYRFVLPFLCIEQNLGSERLQYKSSEFQCGYITLEYRESHELGRNVPRCDLLRFESYISMGRESSEDIRETNLYVSEPSWNVCTSKNVYMTAKPGVRLRPPENKILCIQRVQCFHVVQDEPACSSKLCEFNLRYALFFFLSHTDRITFKQNSDIVNRESTFIPPRWVTEIHLLSKAFRYSSNWQTKRMISIWMM